MRLIDTDAFLENNKEFADRELEHPMYQETLRELIDEAPSIKTKQVKYYDDEEQVWKVGSVIVNDSEKPNNLERSE